jgi:hypothetical protein
MAEGQVRGTSAFSLPHHYRNLQTPPSPSPLPFPGEREQFATLERVHHSVILPNATITVSVRGWRDLVSGYERHHG